MKKVLQEWFIPVSWGKIAIMSWGNPNDYPILLVHGRQDSAATFIPLLELLPDNFYYVAVDMPGNGKSDPFPIGVQLMRFHFVGTIDIVVKHLKWDHFVYIGHSLGCEQGLFYNSIYPGRIQKFIHLDAGPSLQRLQIQNIQEFYQDYYDEYNSSGLDNIGALFSRKGVVSTIMRNRGLNAKQAELILSRNLVEIGDDLYMLTWDDRLIFPPPQNVSVDNCFKLFAKNSAPSILIEATDGYPRGSEITKKLLSDVETYVPDFKVIKVVGGHYVHVTHPERFAHILCNFLKGGRADFYKNMPICKL